VFASPLLGDFLAVGDFRVNGSLHVQPIKDCLPNQNLQICSLRLIYLGLMATALTCPEVVPLQV